MMRVRGTLTPATEDQRLDHEDMVAIAAAVLPTGQREKFKDNHEVDLAYSVAGLGRFRCNAFQQRGTIGMIFRVIPMRVATIDELALPPVLKKIAAEERGLVLVTGTTGSGKSTTLAAMIDEINCDAHRAHHDGRGPDRVPAPRQPLDHQPARDRRRHAARSRRRCAARCGRIPDVILVGEMRDFETIETALLAAETGHLVFSTLHTLDATETINRIIAVFPPHQQKQVRIQLASVLKAVISQRLIPKADGKGRAPAVEVLISTAFIRDCIMDKEKTHLIHGAIAQGTSQYGMQTFDQSIFSLFEQGLVSYEEALRWASNVDEFKLKVQGISTTADMARDQMARTGRRPGAAGDHRFGQRRSTSTSADACADGRRSAYVAGLKMLARRELSEAQVRTAPRPPRVTTPTTSTRPIARLQQRARARRRAATALAHRARRRRSLQAPRPAAGAAADRGRRHRTAAIARARGRRGVRRRSTTTRCSQHALERRLRGRRRSPTNGEFARLYRYLIGQGFERRIARAARRVAAESRADTPVIQ